MSSLSAALAGPKGKGRAKKSSAKAQEEARRQHAARVQHAAHRDPLPAGAGRGDGLLGELDDQSPQRRRPLRLGLLPEADADVRRLRPARHAPRRPPRPDYDPPPHRAVPGALLLPPGRRARHGHLGQRLEPLDRLRLPPDPALGDRQGGARPLRRRPAPAQAEAGEIDRGPDTLPARRRRGLAADRARARPRHDTGRRLRRRGDPGRRRGADDRPRARSSWCSAAWRCC